MFRWLYNIPNWGYRRLVGSLTFILIALAAFLPVIGWLLLLGWGILLLLLSISWYISQKGAEFSRWSVQTMINQVKKLKREDPKAQSPQTPDIQYGKISFKSR